MNFVFESSPTEQNHTTSATILSRPERHGHTTMSSSTTCSNCGKIGHMFYQCKLPITSYGIILFRMNNHNVPELIMNSHNVPELIMNSHNVPEFLMIRRKDSFGYIDFIRGKYSLSNRFQIQKCIDEMSMVEKNRILTLPFTTLWEELWGRATHGTYKSEENISSKKFDILRTVGVVIGDIGDNEPTHTLADMVHSSPTAWREQEWEFPKGRRNFRENDIDCALREFEEETGLDKTSITVIENIVPYKEYFIGSNFKSYKHKFYLAHTTQTDCDMTKFQRSEVSNLEWKTAAECIECIRPYSLEKIRIVQNICKMLDVYSFYS